MALKARYSPLTKPNLVNIYNALTSLTPRDQLIAVIVAGLLVVILIVMPLSWVSGNVSTLKKEVQRSQQKLEEVVTKISEYQLLRAEIQALERRYGRGVASMPATLESIAEKAGLKNNIEGWKDKQDIVGDRFIETPIELKLKNATLKKLIDFIYRIESYPSALLRIRTLEIKPRFSNRVFMDVTLDIANIKLQGEA